ncbi:MAG: DUF1598 domain-containing protein [Planctomycetales bacterium]|nr:DUF1598 domain-containing protein [Planctomycetales bacterium]
MRHVLPIQSRLLLGLMLLCLPSRHVVAQDGANAQVQELLEVKNYRQAAVVASGVGDPLDRDSLLNRIATANPAARGGSSQADFDTLIDLMTATVAPGTWEDDGGTGSAEGFPSGVYVDTQGVLQQLPNSAKKVPAQATERRPSSHRATRAIASAESTNRNFEQTSTRRKVSLSRIERQMQMLRAAGDRPDDSLRCLGGIYRVDALFVYPETGDIVVAGPAGAWRRDTDGRLLNAETGTPVLQLDDLVVLLRNALSERGRFGCSITPVPENLARTQTFLTASSKKPLPVGGRDQWLRAIRDNLGRQEITVHGVDPRTRVARVIVEADYHMKLIGMGLEPGVPGVESYLDAVELDAQGQVPPLEVLRWWFTLGEKDLSANETLDAFRFAGRGVVVLSENELLSKLGERIHTGKSDAMNRAFADSFTQHFDELAEKYPIYADLRNVFDLALVAGIIQGKQLADQAAWSMTYFGDAGTGGLMKYAVKGMASPKEVETVINHRVLNRRVVVAGVSGGVEVRTASAVGTLRSSGSDAKTLDQLRADSAPPSDDPHLWWWD